MYSPSANNQLNDLYYHAAEPPRALLPCQPFSPMLSPALFSSQSGSKPRLLCPLLHPSQPVNHQWLTKPFSQICCTALCTTSSSFISLCLHFKLCFQKPRRWIIWNNSFHVSLYYSRSSWCFPLPIGKKSHCPMAGLQLSYCWSFDKIIPSI